MRKSCIVLFCVVAGAIASCASEPDDSAVKPRSAKTVSLEEPVIRAEVLPVAAGTVVDLVRGTAYVTRDHREAIEIHGALALEQDDLLQIYPDSAVRLRSPEGKAIELRRDHGEWFRFSMREK
ncbi:hypothetical protein GCM10011487_37360 [Steroidobacter agaridevorans]|uniref:Uncharacterized protein n=1 Tax=Steroidobacter agaridevorans TaxID=2695856 RepID=A0A829YGL9_9GAMM|nr:hypothetical protein [Steroidobacter agaridevorans]GFE81736.1 hypothetical protein GCM10011487_37360 [Steroidobacter agaridevorans]